MHKKQKPAVLYWVGLVISFLFCSLAHAQFEDGSLVGTIHDSTGAAVAGANIQVVNTATGIQNTAVSNGSGDYEVLSLRVGSYRITASASGFASAVANNITISVGSRQRIDLTLKPGQAQTTVEVSDVALQLETDSSQRGQNITNYQTEALPLVSRNYSDLLGLVTGSRQAPTAATTSSINSLVRQGAYNVNGQRSMFNNFLLDGMDNNAYGESNQGFDNQIIAIPPDSVAQFSVVTNNESAEYGRSSGATVNVASASGTNQFHATLYEFLRNTDLNADGFFKPNVVSNTGSVTPFKKPTFNRNQFGMNFGGPIIKDKLFFFLDYEGFRQTLTPLSVLTLPTQNELNGNLVVPVKDPLTGNIYPAGTADSHGRHRPAFARRSSNDFAKLSLPQSGLATTGLNSNDYSAQVPFTDNSDKGDLRLDYQQNASSSWFLRVSDRKETGVNYPAIAAAARRTDQRHHPHPRPAGSSRLYASLRREQDRSMRASASRAPRPANTLFRSATTLWDHHPRSAPESGRRRRPAFHRHHRLHRLRPAEHQPAVAEPGAARSQGELHLGQGQPLAQVRL